MTRREDDRKEWMFFVAGMTLILGDVLYVALKPNPDRWIVLVWALAGAGVISRNFMGDLVQIAKAKFRAPDP